MNQPNPQRISELLSQVATIAYVTTTCVGMTRLDKDASKQADLQHGAVAGAGKVHVSRLAGCEDRIKEIRAVQVAAGNVLKEFTTQWGKNRLLMNTFIQPFMQEWASLKAEHDRLHQRIIADAPSLIARAENNMGSYNIDPVTEAELRDGFTMEFKLEAVPDTANFSAKGLDKQVEDVLRMRIERDMEATYQQSQKDLIERLKAPLANLAQRMEAYSEREKANDGAATKSRAGVFHDTVVSNVASVAKLIEACNVTNDPLLTSIADKLAALDGIEAADLRKDAALRDDTAKRAKEILADLDDWI